MASAMIERAEFPEHKKRTLKCFSIGIPLAWMVPHSGSNGRAAIRTATGFFRSQLLGKVVLEDGEDFPFVPVGIADPRLVLQRVAAFRFHFVARQQGSLLPSLSNGQEVGRRFHLDSEMRQGPLPRLRPLVQSKIERRIRHVKFRVSNADLAGLYAEQLPVE